MKINCIRIATICFVAMALFTACNQKFPGYKKTESGLYYKFYCHNTSAQKPQLTDVLGVAMTCYLGDSVYFDFQNTDSQLYTQIKESAFPADLNEAYAMMNLGDSASFYIKADSVAIKYYGKDPESVGLKPDDYFRYEVKLMEIKPLEVFQAEIEKANGTVEERSRRMFEAFLNANGITDHTPSGLYYTKSVVTDGPSPQRGQTARIKFEAFCLDGSKIGSTDDNGKLFDLAYGRGTVLKGLEEGVGLMHVGEKARFVLPYTLAYGDQPYEAIPAYSNLIFDVELVDIK